ncbi:MAG: hypothetical protein GF401_12940 [Chitinivibrionales bacterium]|nr:hypothetical protein [Chitinivibrionales bacterium]
MKKLLIAIMGLSALMLIIGCGVSDKKLLDAENRINALLNKGVPDSSLSRAKVFLYQARSAMERGDRGLAGQSADSMMILIAQAESEYDDMVKNLNPVIDSLRRFITNQRRELDGLQQHKLDSVVAKADSFSTLNWVLQTENYLNQAANMIPQLKFDQERAEELKPRLPGQWLCQDRKKSDANKEINLVESKIFDFHRKGNVTYTEKGKGQGGTHYKLDYLFISEGNWDIMGDTVVLLIDRFRRVKEKSWEKVVEGKRVTWNEKSAPPIDSTITDGSQDRFITFSDLKKDFKRVKRY